MCVFTLQGSVIKGSRIEQRCISIEIDLGGSRYLGVAWGQVYINCWMWLVVMHIILSCCDQRCIAVFRSESLQLHHHILIFSDSSFAVYHVLMPRAEQGYFDWLFNAVLCTLTNPDALHADSYSRGMAATAGLKQSEGDRNLVVAQMTGV